MMLYICPECGFWFLPGLLDAMFSGGIYLPHCKECQTVMIKVAPEDRLIIRPALIESTTDNKMLSE